MKNRILERAILAALGCGLALAVPATFAADQDLKSEGSVTAGIQTTDSSGDESNLQRNGSGLDDTVIAPRIDWSANDGRGYARFLGVDVGQRDEYLGVESGLYGLFEAEVFLDRWYRDYSDGAMLGTRTSPGYWAVDDSIQQALQPEFPVGGNPTPAGQAMLLGFLADAEVIDLHQQRAITGGKIRFTPLKGLGITAGYTAEDRDGTKAIGSGSYRRAATGATAIGGLGENFRAYGQEVPMPLEYRTTGVDVGLDYQVGHFYFEVAYSATEFDNHFNSLTYENPLLFTSLNGQVGGAAVHRSVLAPDYDSQAVNASIVVSDLPLRTKINVSYAQDEVTQNDPFYPLTVNTAVLDDAGAVAANLPLPARDLDGDVTTRFINAVLSSRPIDALAVNLRYNSYDYQNDSARLLWTGWVGIGETTWKDYDGSNAVQQPYYNRVPEYERTRYGLDAVYSLGSTLKLKGEYWDEQYDRNGDRYADNTEDTFRVSLQWLVSDWGTLRVGYRNSQRDIDGEYTEHLDSGVQEEWGELRMFDMADRDREGFDVYFSVDPLPNLSVGVAANQTDDTYDEEFYGLHEGKSLMVGLDVSWAVTEGVSLSAYYSHDRLESDQLNRTKSDGTGGGSFALPQNDWRTRVTDESDAYGLEISAAVMPEKLTLFASADFSTGTTQTDTSNPNYVAGVTVSGALAYDWPDATVDTTQVKAGVDYRWTRKVSTALTYLYLKQDIEDFATDGVVPYYGAGPLDTQGNRMSHYVFMDANPSDYDANVFMLTVTYGF